MSNYDWIAPRERGKSLFIVEGNHEKNELIKFLLMFFPELCIRDEDVLIYGTNIYMLYEAIVSAYEEDWDSQDVDLPYVVSEKKGYEIPLRKDDFINIVLIFDYERHDPNFSEDKICRMQKYFIDSTDVGKLYINYPMVESYRHFPDWPNDEFEDTNILVSLQPGKRYKSLITDSYVSGVLEWFHKVDDTLLKKFYMIDEKVRSQVVNALIHINSQEETIKCLGNLIKDNIDENYQKTAIYQLDALLKELFHWTNGRDYYTFVRLLFIEIIRHNIYKANKILNGKYEIAEDSIREVYENIELLEILKNQNIGSRDLVNGIIWVLNTSVFIVADYNFSIIETVYGKQSS